MVAWIVLGVVLVDLAIMSGDDLPVCRSWSPDEIKDFTVKKRVNNDEELEEFRRAKANRMAKADALKEKVGYVSSDDTE